MENEDEKLVALIDNELDEDERRRLLTRLDRDAALRGRYEALQGTGAPIAAVLDGLLKSAPLNRLRAVIPKAEASPVAPWLLRGKVRALAVGIAVAFLAAGIGAWAALRLAPQEEKEGWRTAVVEYMELYTNETFALDDSDLTAQEKKLGAIGEKLDVHLSPENLVIPGLRFKTAQLLNYDGAPLAEIAYVDARGAPVLFCIIAAAGADLRTQSERRGDLSLASWSKGGRSYLVISRLSEQETTDLARTFERRFSGT
jgi:anti-sigma factor RsiW